MIIVRTIDVMPVIYLHLSVDLDSVSAHISMFKDWLLLYCVPFFTEKCVFRTANLFFFFYFMEGQFIVTLSSLIFQESLAVNTLLKSEKLSRNAFVSKVCSAFGGLLNSLFTSSLLPHTIFNSSES